MPVGEVEQCASRFCGVDRAGRVVRVDDDERARRRGDEALQVIQIGHPATRRIEPVALRFRVELREHGRVERIGRHRHEHFAAAFHHGAQRELDAFRRARGHEHTIRADRKSVRRVLRGHSLARGRNAGGRTVGVVALLQRAFDCRDQVRRRLEAEGDRVADIEIPHPRTGGLGALGFGNDVADGVGETVNAGSGRD